MRELKYFVACTVDGFIAAEDGSTDAFVNESDYLADLFESFPRPVRGTFAKRSAFVGRTSTSTSS